MTLVDRHCLNKRRRKCLKEAKGGHRAFFLLFLMGLISLASVAYIFQVNKIATAGYKIKQKEQQLNKLKEENENLKIRVAQLSSITRLEEEKNKAEMRKPQEVGFLEIEISQAVALK